MTVLDAHSSPLLLDSLIATAPSPSTDETVPEVAPEDAASLCKYPSKRCLSRRAVKRNGEMHNLCDFHRAKANKNQRRLEQKRKTRAATSAASAAPTRRRTSRPRAISTPRGVLSTHIAMQEDLRSRALLTPMRTSGRPLPSPKLHISTARADEEIERALLAVNATDEDVARLCGTLDEVPIPTTSPVDVSDGWDAFDAGGYWELPTDLDLGAVARV